jgi:hypothetical protein
MRRPRRENPQAGEHAQPAAVTQARPRYPRPKILVVGAPHIASFLRDRGYFADSGTFGTVQTVPAERGWWPVETGLDLPGHTEKEVVVIDLAMPGEARAASGSSAPQHGVTRVWAPVTRGTIDPGPLANVVYARGDGPHSQAWRRVRGIHLPAPHHSLHHWRVRPVRGSPGA